MLENEGFTQAVSSVLDGLDIIEANACSVLDQIAEERAVLEGLLLLVGAGTYRQKNVENEVDFCKNGCKNGKNGCAREAAAC